MFINHLFPKNNLNQDRIFCQQMISYVVVVELQAIFGLSSQSIFFSAHKIKI